MIITCINCNKKFDVNPSAIPANGRLLQCNGCNHKWFFKKETINKSTIPIKIDIPVEEKVEKKIVNTQTIELLDNALKEDLSIKDQNTKEDKNIPHEEYTKNKKGFNKFSVIVVFIISFIALIITIDTFQGSISRFIPNIEPLLYNLYETINDIMVFLIDLF